MDLVIVLVLFVCAVGMFWYAGHVLIDFLAWVFETRHRRHLSRMPDRIQSLRSDR